MSQSDANSEDKQEFQLSVQSCFGELQKAEQDRWKANQLPLFGAKNADAWQRNSKNSWSTGKDMMDFILEKAAGTLYEHYIGTKVSDHIISASFQMADTLLVNEFQEFDVNQEIFEPAMIEEDEEPVRHLPL